CEDEDLIINIVYKDDWHEGVIGIVASRLVETFKVPAIVFSNAEEEGVIKASARSAGPLNLFDCLNQNSDLFIKFGGHKAAAGLSMKKENLPLLKENLKNLLRELPLIERTVPEDYDLEITAHEINSELLSHLDLLEPFGMGNEKPLFKVRGLTLQSFDLLKEVHVRWNFLSSQNGPNGSPLRLKGISFNYVGKWGVLSPDRIYDLQFAKDSDLSVYCHLSLNRFNGRESIQLMVEKITL
ncbi:MAG: DHHA1 domain-containing protein, partial [Bdellovibrionota bacterium]|nr:DHHA1 domain-containing protein [Bdellovibrionota bacterium]